MTDSISYSESPVTIISSTYKIRVALKAKRGKEAVKENFEARRVWFMRPKERSHLHPSLKNAR